MAKHKAKHKTMGEDKHAKVGNTKGLTVIVNAKQQSYNLEQAMNIKSDKGHSKVGKRG